MCICVAVCVFERLGLVGGEGSTLEKHSINYHSLSAIVCLFCVYLRVFVCVCVCVCVFGALGLVGGEGEGAT